jgi:hypothetical protein
MKINYQPSALHIRSALIVAACAFLFSNCTQYKYIRLASEMETTPNKAFIFENDTVRIQYRFDGFYCPVKIEIFNKLTSPLYVDWAKSSVIINGSSRSLWKDESGIELVTTGLEINDGKSTFSTDAISKGTVKRKEQISYIPPDSYISKSITISPSYFDIYNGFIYYDERIDNNTKDQNSLNLNNSPYKSRLHLVLSSSNTFSNPIYFDMHFLAKDIANGYANPFNLKSENLIFSLLLIGGVIFQLILLKNIGGSF